MKIGIVMTLDELKKYISDTYSTDMDYPWRKYPNHGVFRHSNNRKWFALLMDVSKDKLGLESTEMLNILNVKLEPMMIDVLKSLDGFFPAYHMNKSSWITIALDGSVDDEQIKNLIDISFNMTMSKVKMKKNTL